MKALANGNGPKKLDEKTLKGLREVARVRSRLLQKIGKLTALRRGKELSIKHCLSLPGTAKGRSHLRHALNATPFPRYEAVPKRPGFLIRTEANGTRQYGRFVGRKFQVTKA